MSQDSRYDEDENEFADITPYDNYQLAFRDSETKRRYQGQLEMFINQVTNLIDNGDIAPEIGQPILEAATGIQSSYCS